MYHSLGCKGIAETLTAEAEDYGPIGRNEEALRIFRGSKQTFNLLLTATNCSIIITATMAASTTAPAL